MEDLLLDRETLGKFVDELIKQKALPVDNTEELNKMREDSIKSLDDKIGMAIFGRLNEEQNEEINQLLDQNEEDPDVFRRFFESAGIDTEKVIKDTMQEFGNEFLGGQNA